MAACPEQVIQVIISLVSKGPVLSGLGSMQWRISLIHVRWASGEPLDRPARYPDNNNTNE